MPMLLPARCRASAGRRRPSPGPACSAGDLLRRSAGTRAAPCRSRAGSPRAETLATRPGAARRRAARRRCSRWDGQLEDDARLVTDDRAHRGRARRRRAHPRPGARRATGTAVDPARRAHRRDRRGRAPAPSSTPPACGPATSSTTSRSAPAAAPTWCCAARRCPGLTRRGVRTDPGRDQPLRAACCPSPTARSTSASPTSRPTATSPTCRADRGRDRLPARRGLGGLLATAAPQRRGRRVRRAASAARHGRRLDRRPVPQARRAHQRAPGS